MPSVIGKDVGSFMEGACWLQKGRSFYRFQTVTFVSALVAVLCLCMAPPLQGAAGSAHGRPNRATSVVNRFYEIVSGLQGEGVPDSATIESLAPYLSSDFLIVLRNAWKKEKQYQEDASEPVPPQIEGSLFCSLFEGFTSIRSITPDNVRANYLNIAFHYDPGRKNHTDSTSSTFLPVSWTDRVIITKENGRTVIDDIYLMNQASFGLRGSVKEILKDLKAD